MTENNTYSRPVRPDSHDHTREIVKEMEEAGRRIAAFRATLGVRTPYREGVEA